MKNGKRKSLKWENAETVQIGKPTIYVQSIMPICVRNVLSAMILKYIANFVQRAQSGLWKEES